MKLFYLDIMYEYLCLRLVFPAVKRNFRYVTRTYVRLDQLISKLSITVVLFWHI